MAEYKKYKDKFLYGSNTLRAKEIFQQRKEYDELYPSNLNPSVPLPIDFRERESYYYGCLDFQGRYLLPDINYLELINGPDQVFALDFVADAYKGFLFYMNTKASVKMIDDGERIKSGWKASRGWNDIDLKRQQIKDGLYKTFVSSYMDIEVQQKMSSFDHFLDFFLNSYVGYVKSFPLTYSGFYQSNMYDRLSTGLCVDIYKDDPSEDYKKFDTFINNINFRDYAQAAASFGFVIDKHAPYRLVANLNSPAMRFRINQRMRLNLMPRTGNVSITETPNLSLQSNPTFHFHEYSIDKYGNGETSTYTVGGKPHYHKITRYQIVPNPGLKDGDLTKGVLPHVHFLEAPEIPWTFNDFYETYYYRLIDIEVEDLKNTFFNMFSRLIQEYPDFYVPSKCDSSSDASDIFTKNSFFQQTVMIKKSNNFLTKENFDEKYDDLFWAKTHFLIRLHELGVDLNKRKKTNVLSKIEDLYINVDKETALVYVNNYLRQFY